MQKDNSRGTRCLGVHSQHLSNAAPRPSGAERQRRQVSAILSPNIASLLPLSLSTSSLLLLWGTLLQAAATAVRHYPILETLHSPTHLWDAVGSRRSHAYEPLLLENERDAVADLLQFLESTSVMWILCAPTPTFCLQTGRRLTSSRASLSPHLPYSLSQITSISNGVLPLLLPRSPRRRSTKSTGRPSTPCSSSLAVMIQKFSVQQALHWAI